MGDKKRKELPGGSEVPKKVKKSKAADTPASPTTALVEPKTEVKSTKKSRKRAADFLDDNDAENTGIVTNGAQVDTENVDKEDTRPHKKRSKKSKHQTTDDTNGVVDRAGDSNTEIVPSTMQAEAQRTVDQELEDEYGSGADNAADDGDLGAALLAGFDSDTSDHAEDQGFDVDNLGGIPNAKKTKKKLRKIEKKGDADTPGAIYVGRIPHGFYEPQMREYFSQFGDITRLRLSRNKKTGASKHFAFIEFASEEVAKIVAGAMDNYLMFGHILKCKFAPAESLHPDVWKGANKKFRKIPYQKLEQEKLTAPKSADQWRKKNDREEKKRDKTAKKLKQSMGYEAPKVTLADPIKAIEANKLEAAKPKEIEDATAVEESSIPLAIEAPQSGIGKGGAGTPSNEKASTLAKKKGVGAPRAFKKPKIPINPVTGKPSHRDAKGKYVPPLQRKQRALAKFAKDNPEAHLAATKAKAAAQQQQRRDKKQAKKQKQIAKFGSKNVKGGEKFRISKDAQAKAEGAQHA